MSRILFAFKHHWVQIIIAASAAGYLLWLATKQPDSHNSIQLAEAMTGLITFLIALFVWFIQMNREWKESLGKRLTVRFEYKGSTILECKEALLTGDADIRQWGQQIGRQMTFQSTLEFDPYIYLETPEIKYNPAWQTHYLHYVATFYLNGLPDMPKADPLIQKEWHERFEKGDRYFWEPEYKSNKTIIVERDWKVQDSRPRTIHS